MDILKEQYGIDEEDFISAELEAVPAGHARDLGFDRSMIMGYGHDDRVCAYPSMAAVLNYEGTPEYTLAAVLTDKEEIGSVGATGMGAMYFREHDGRTDCLRDGRGQAADPAPLPAEQPYALQRRERGL